MNAVRRDEGGKRVLLGQMTGSDRHLERLIDPAAFWGGKYPNAIPQDKYSTTGLEPSIRGRQLYIPLMAWFCYSTKTALPLIALQYQEVHIKIEFRAIKDIFTVLDVEQPNPCTNCTNSSATYVPSLNLKRKAPNSASVTDQMWKFLQPPSKLPVSDEERAASPLI